LERECVAKDSSAKVTDLKARFASAVRRRRNELGLTQEELAWRAGLHRTYLARVESGSRNPSLENIGKLVRALETSLGRLFGEVNAADARRGPPAEGASGRRPLDILLVEDNPRDVELTLRALAKARLTNRVQVFRDGAAVLDYLLLPGRDERRLATNAPPLVLLDLTLPKVSGIEVLRRLRADARTRCRWRS